MNPSRKVPRMFKKLNPLQMVAREMTEHSDLDCHTIEESLSGVLSHLQSRAVIEINEDANSDTASVAALQYRVVCEAIAMFGTQLIAYEDIEEDVSEGEQN